MFGVLGEELRHRDEAKQRHVPAIDMLAAKAVGDRPGQQAAEEQTDQRGAPEQAQRQCVQAQRRGRQTDGDTDDAEHVAVTELATDTTDGRLDVQGPNG
ncbi:hypothetical protein D3C80_830300 [compost metagenome]